MTFVETPPVVIPPVEQLEEMKNIQAPRKPRKTRAPKHDFKDGRGRVFAHRHTNGRGWVEDTAYVDDATYVGAGCEVFNHACIDGTCRLEGRVKISAHAHVSGKAFLSEYATINGQAVVRDDVRIMGNARVSGKAVIAGGSSLHDTSFATDRAYVFNSNLRNNSCVGGDAMIVRSNLWQSVEVRGNAAVIHANISGYLQIMNFAQILHSHISAPNAGDGICTVLIRDHAVVTDSSDLCLQNVLIGEHAMIIRSTFTNTWRNGEYNVGNRLSINGNIVFASRHFNDRDTLFAFVNDVKARGQNTDPKNSNNVAGQWRPAVDIATSSSRRLMRLPTT